MKNVIVHAVIAAAETSMNGIAYPTFEISAPARGERKITGVVQKTTVLM